MEKQYDPSYFQLVQENEKLMDKKLRTKQLSYFQDAMLRFTKNKYNVTATIILLIMILMSIFVPMITPKYLYSQTNAGIMTLPPRIPILELIGITDGTKLYKNQPVQVNTIEIDEDGKASGTPEGFDMEYIKPGSIKYSYTIGTEVDEKYVGGTNTLYVNYDRIGYSVASNTLFTYTNAHEIVLDIESITEGATLKVYLSQWNTSSFSRTWDQLELLGTVTSEGIHRFDPMDGVSSGTARFIVLKLELPEKSVDGSENVVFNSVQIQNKADETVLQDYTGYTLATFVFYTHGQGIENGRFVRKDAKMLVAEFVYDVYGAIFADKPATIGRVEYERILSENPGMEDTIEMDENDPRAWTFGSGYPLSAVTGYEDFTVPGTGLQFRNYFVMKDGAYAVGFEDTPYFLFGTDEFGRDLFTLIWLGLRTSLLLGFMAAAVNIVVGIIWGSTSAYYGGQVDILMERFVDIWGSFPQITMIGIITVLIGPGFTALFIFMIYDGWIGAAGITRIQFYRYKGREYVLAARTLGASDRRIIFKHILPNALGTIVTRVVLSIPSVIFLEVNLSFLGFGIGNGQTLAIGPIELTGTSIGVILNDGQQQIMAGNTWLVIFPTLVVATLMISFNMFGNALRDALNPQLRGSE
ncbi:ABC transporter permease [Paracholeplasma manati]|uniref:ABC transporter permease n=1 Tax=Paracholeplasma manati TaxID=591373 RepID=A0ABT2Y6W0_9MOLU|nr:ABC transporter permease [Paracholeplasma manati]MCV2232471.1 ABC transporter permease [Paracholeplasma manati]MDG0888723.1 ABC transporter permease [Paracholeplasma manati]